MAVTIKNIIVGAGRLYLTDTVASCDVYPELPDFTGLASGDSVNDAFESDADWSDVGGTDNGVEIGYEPDYVDIEVDQLKDAAKIFNQGSTMTMNTTLKEATLENLLLAWSFADSALSSNTFSIGIPADEPVERSAAVVGPAPRDPNCDERERIYHARRVISVQGSTHALRRTEETMFPVSFRLLPDPQYVGSEYGKIIDRLKDTA